MGYNEDDIGFQDNDASELAAQFNSAGKVTLREQVKQLFIVTKGSQRNKFQIFYRGQKSALSRALQS